jgi:RNA-directed DNA polymerase
MDKAKSYHISKHAVFEAYKRVRANGGAEGIDGVTIKEFEEKLEDNLYKIWNRMSSGSYFPPPVKAVEIPKPDGRKRKLGIPTVSDRIAQMVVKMYLEPLIDPIFHQNSYGYRPNKSGLDAVKITRERCWKYDWVIDIDIKGFFDNLDHELMMKAVEKHTQEPWILLYVQRWLQAPIKEVDGSVVKRARGTPQGGVISPLCANLFLHYAFDEWMKRSFPENPFARYADDIVIHCQTKEEAEKLKDKIKKRLLECKLELHPDKTKIVYCKDSNRTGSSEHEKFDFLGYTFRPRSSRNKHGKLFTNFSPAMSEKAQTRSREVVKSWLKEVKPNEVIMNLALVANSVIRGWINYFGKFYASELWPLMKYIENNILKWGKKKYAKLKHSICKAKDWLQRTKEREPNLFVHWQWMRRHDSSGRAV